jgi:hypothetical protein
VDEERGLPLRIDPDAKSAQGDKPAFLARPAGAPVYHGFAILDDVEVDGFRLGMISDWEAEPSEWGDAFLVAPDNSRCGLIWEVTAEPYVSAESQVPADETRWGVWNVGFPHPMTRGTTRVATSPPYSSSCARDGIAGGTVGRYRRSAVAWASVPE